MSRRRKKAALGCGALLLALVILFLALPTRAILFPRRYDVVSIAAAPEFKDAARLERAHAQPGVSAYPSPIFFQTNPSICGPTSLANVFRSFGEAGVTPAEVVAGSGKCGSGYCFMGLTLDELAEIARRRPGYRVTVLRDLTLDMLRDHLGRAANDPTRRYIVNFDRGPLFGKGGGHHSPIGGFLPDEDLVLVLDVNQTFAPWLTKTERLFVAMDTVDGSSDKKRGLLLVEHVAR